MKYKITYEAPPISEVPKECMIEVADNNGLTFYRAGEAVSRVSESLVYSSDIIKVEPVLNDDFCC